MGVWVWGTPSFFVGHVEQDYGTASQPAIRYPKKMKGLFAEKNDSAFFFFFPRLRNETPAPRARGGCRVFSRPSFDTVSRALNEHTPPPHPVGSVARKPAPGFGI